MLLKSRLATVGLIALAPMFALSSLPAQGFCSQQSGMQQASWPEEKSALLADMAQVQHVDRENFERVLQLYGRAAHLLREHMDDDILAAVGRIYPLIFSVDSNYDTTEIFIPVFESDETGFLAGLHKVMNEKDYKAVQDHIRIIRRERREGNG